MDYREAFNEIMHYGNVDSVPLIHWNIWPETRERWVSEGMPRGVDEHEFFGALPIFGSLIDLESWVGLAHPGDAIDIGLFPAFQEEIYEDTDEYRVLRQGDGVVVKDFKHSSSIPLHIEHTLKNASGWELYKERLQPHPGRISADFDRIVEASNNSGLPICLPCGSLMGWIRNWMGVENMTYLIYDDRDVYADMVMTIAKLVCWGLDVVNSKIRGDLGLCWEDICSRSGPLVSPSVFDDCVAPGYAKIRNKLEEYGTDLLAVDSDGDINALVGHWMDAGVNMMFPLEVGVFGGDALRYRKQFGRELRLFGNFDKRVLELGQRSVESEFARLLPLMKEGGFLVMPDHWIPPTVSLAGYQEYLHLVGRARI